MMKKDIKFSVPEQPTDPHDDPINLSNDCDMVDDDDWHSPCL